MITKGIRDRRIGNRFNESLVPFDSCKGIIPLWGYIIFIFVVRRRLTMTQAVSVMEWELR